jgi:hypothetical protein
MRTCVTFAGGEVLPERVVWSIVAIRGVCCFGKSAANLKSVDER